nr:hypothetical protein RSP673_14875 [Ralstonia solanacearum P673]
MIEVWSKVCEHTQPPLDHGDATSIGMPWPRPAADRDGHASRSA